MRQVVVTVRFNGPRFNDEDTEQDSLVERLVGDATAMLPAQSSEVEVEIDGEIVACVYFDEDA